MLKSLLKNIRPWGLGVVCAAASVGLGSCIEDGISTSPSDQPEFSVDTLAIGDVFTDETTPTYSFKVYNRHDKVMSINSIRLTGSKDYFRLNVDGQSGLRPRIRYSCLSMSICRPTARLTRWK